MLILVNDSPYFDIVIRALHEVLSELQVPHKIAKEADLKDVSNVYLLCTVHEGKPLPPRYIAYQFEQLTTTKEWPLQFWTRLKAAVVVWDYSQSNIQELQKRGIPALHVPLGYAKCMEYPFWKQENPPFDFVFLGAMNQARMGKLLPLFKVYRAKSDRLFVKNGVWGDDIGKVYAASKIGINMHYYEGNTILEVHRIIPMIANRLWVISEHGSDYWYDEMYHDLVTWYKGDMDLARQGLAILIQDPVKFEEEVERRYKVLKSRCSFLSYVSRVPVLHSIPK